MSGINSRDKNEGITASHAAHKILISFFTTRLILKMSLMKLRDRKAKSAATEVKIVKKRKVIVCFSIH